MYVCIIIIGNDNFLVDYEQLIGYFYFLFFYFLP